jgi:hypothetical protein
MVAGHDSLAVLSKKFRGDKRYVVVMQEPVPSSLKLGAKSSHIFMRSP